MAPWNKIFNKNFIKKNNAYFQSLTSSNDVFFALVTVINASKISYINESYILHRTATKTQISANRDSYNFYLAVKHLLDNIDIDKLDNKSIHVQIAKLIIIVSYSEFRRCKDINRNELTYSAFKSILKEEYDKIVNYFSDKLLLNLYLSNYDEFVRYISNYEVQIDYHIDELKQVLSGYKCIILWGNGKRGNAFQNVCKKNNIILYGIVDSANTNISEKSEYGFRILDLDSGIKKADCIVACNNMVYSYVKNNVSNANVICLQDYCPQF